MKLEPFCTVDIGGFLDLARQERWIAQQWELEFLLGNFPTGGLVVRDDNGDTIGFVTSLPHTTSGWVGNLVVAAGRRGEGIGEKLFRASLQALLHEGVTTVWLTASNSGKSLYEKHGFTRIDTIHRWKGARSWSPGAMPCAAETGCTCLTVSIDADAWGDNRESLLRAVMGRGVTRCNSGGFVTVQAGDSCCQIGPYAAYHDRAAAELLSAGLDMAPPGMPIYLDVPESNRSASLLLDRMGFTICGANELMFFGKKPAYRPELVYGLATMGSCG